MPAPEKGYPALRRGRYSVPTADYFLTLCARRPSSVLGEPRVAAACRDEMQRLEASGHWRVRCAVVMPDHVHLLATLGPAQALSDVVRLFKGRLASVLRRNQAAWQPGFYDHRLRRDEALLPIFHYIYRNPYRAGLCPGEVRWPGYHCSAEDWKWYAPLLNEAGLPEPEWLR